MITEEKSDFIRRLSPRKQLAFGLLIFERMLPYLIAFSKDTGFDPSCYLQAKDIAWDALKNGTAEQELNTKCARNAPDTEKFSHKLTSHALNAALAMNDIVSFIRDGGADHIGDVSTLARDSVYLYVSSLEPSLVSSKEEDVRIGQHPLTQQELRREEEDIKFLHKLPDDLDEDSISRLKSRAFGQTPLLML